ncbi:hypothetical protein [Falsiroseomonas sp. CW058]|uniref:hypothetical protein n=1 Tax=Falsiroseomonas sp. CW058 TaxID=3388664 RepID=UPI003D31211E
MCHGDQGVDVLSKSLLISADLSGRRPQVGAGVPRAAAGGRAEAIRARPAAVRHIARHDRAIGIVADGFPLPRRGTAAGPQTTPSRATPPRR